MKRSHLLVFTALVASAIAIPTSAFASQGTPMYRLYNRWTGEHLYTAKIEERNDLMWRYWNYEGIGWIAPKQSATPVYRLYNPYTSDHHYTTSKEEYDKCISRGWMGEDIAWYSDEDKTVPLYRQFNPYETVGTHNYTISKAENDKLAKIGWKEEGIAWYGITGDAEDWTDHDVPIVVAPVTPDNPTSNGSSSSSGSGSSSSSSSSSGSDMTAPTTTTYYYVAGSSVYHTKWCRSMAKAKNYRTYSSLQDIPNSGSLRLCKNCQ